MSYLFYGLEKSQEKTKRLDTKDNKVEIKSWGNHNKKQAKVYMYCSEENKDNEIQVLFS